jgi:hypothetical protein
MILRTLGLVATLVAALLPSISNASPEKDAVSACAHAFATNIATPGATPTYKLDYQGDRLGSWSPGPLGSAGFFANGYTFDLQAHDPKTGEAIARARCSTNLRAVVIALTSLPVDSRLYARLD